MRILVLIVKLSTLVLQVKKFCHPNYSSLRRRLFMMTKIFISSLPCFVKRSRRNWKSVYHWQKGSQCNLDLDQKTSHNISSIYLQPLTISKNKSQYICFQFKVGSSCMQGWRVSMEVSGGLEFRIYYSSEQNLKSFRKSIMILFF